MSLKNQLQDKRFQLVCSSRARDTFPAVRLFADALLSDAASLLLLSPCQVSLQLTRCYSLLCFHGVRLAHVIGRDETLSAGGQGLCSPPLPTSAGNMRLFQHMRALSYSEQKFRAS